MTGKPIRVAVLGASGYGAGELLRLFTQHPHVDVVSVTSRGDESLAKLHPHLRRFYPDLRVTGRIDPERLCGAQYAVIIAAQPHGASAVGLGEALNDVRTHGGERGLEKVRSVDLSGDLRLKDAMIHQRHYPESNSPTDLRSNAVYGLPELQRDTVRGARIVANPGCLATAAILAGAPLINREFRGSVVIDTKTGSSGSGRALKDATHHPTRHADFRAYKPLSHQHEPEILQAWGDASGERIATSFVAQSMDTTRGIFATVHLTLNDSTTTADLREHYGRFYADSPFIRIVEDSPTLQNVVGSNFCDIGVVARGKQVIAMAALDNLIKGMAGAAIQNMNLMCGLEETTGLWQPSLRPL